jgi:tetratricopeptide (TPR) repeat protein
MTLAPTTWGELRQLAHEALDEGDYPLADRYVQQMVEEAERSESPGQLASAFFSLGMLRHAEGELDEAEEAFERAVENDIEAHGPAHEAVADALRSLGLVQRDMGPEALARAVESFERAAATYARCKPAMVPDALGCAGGALLRAERYDEARGCFERAVASALRWCGSGHKETLQAMLGLGEAQRCNRETMAAYSTFSRATRMEVKGPEAAVNDLRSRAWYSLGLLAGCFQGGGVEAKLAWLFARDLAQVAAVRQKALERLADLPDVAVADTGGELAWRVARAHGDEICHLLHPHRGHWVLRCAAPAPLGAKVPAAVDVEAMLRAHAAYAPDDEVLADVDLDLDDLPDGDDDSGARPPQARAPVRFVMKRGPVDGDLGRWWREPPAGPPVDLDAVVAELDLRLGAVRVTAQPDGGRRVASEGPPLVLYPTHAVVDLTEVELDDDELDDPVDAARDFLGMLADVTGWCGSLDGRELEVEPEIDEDDEDEEQEEDEESDSDGGAPPGGYEAWARALVDELLARGLIELTSKRSRVPVENRLAVLLEDECEELADALVEVAGVAELFCDDDTLRELATACRPG